MVLTKEEMVCPSGRPGGSPIIIDMKKASTAESRIQEIETLTPMKAPGLLAAFTVAWKDLHRNMVSLTKELTVAERYADKVKAIVILDKAPEVLKQMGLIRAGFPSGSEDQRRSVLDKDDTYADARKTVEDIQEAVETLNGMLKSFDMAYTAVKKLIDNSQSSMMNKVNPELRY
jgi:hypothetical protein